MFDFLGMFSIFAAVACAFLALLAIVLKLCGVLLLGWPVVLLPLLAAVVFAFLGVNGVG